MKFNSQGVLGEGVKEGMESILHTLDACLALLVAYLMGTGNMRKPELAVYQGGMQERICRVPFNVVLFTEWEVLESKCKLGVEILSNLELSSLGKTIQYPIMDYMEIKDPEAVGD